MSATQTEVDEYLVPIPEDEMDDTINSKTKSEEQNDDPEDEDPFKKTYLAIDGVEEHEISDTDKERLERTVIEFMLHNGYPISGVRILSEDTNVIELDREE